MRINLHSVYYDTFPEVYGTGKKTVEFYVDYDVFKVSGSEQNAIALLVEPRAIMPGVYYWMEENYNKFRYVFTFDSVLLKLENAKLLIYGQITAEYPNENKRKDISMVASDKDGCAGHRTRQWVATLLTDRIDTYGRFNGGPYCTDREYLAEYKFNVAMENYSDGHYFTEKICNCFASRTVPIYWGCPHIGEYFNMDGIVYCERPEDVLTAVDRIRKDPLYEYAKRCAAIEDNLRRVQKYRSYASLFLETYCDLLESIPQ